MTRTAQSVTAAPSMTAPGSPVAKHRDWGPLQRGAGSVRSMNMAGVERVLSVIAGGALLLRGLRRFSWRGLLGAACGAVLLQRGISGHCPLYGALGIGTRKPGHGRSPGVPGDRGIQVERVVTIHAPPTQLFAFWRQLHNLPRIMQHLESVREVDARISHWVAKGPFEQRVEWYAQIINEVPNEMIAWASLEGSDIGTAGSVHFKPVSDGGATEVRVRLRYDPPGGVIGAAFARLFGEDPAQQIAEDLRRFKHMVEARSTS